MASVSFLLFFLNTFLIHGCVWFFLPIHFLLVVSDLPDKFFILYSFTYLSKVTYWYVGNKMESQLALGVYFCLQESVIM